MKVLKLVVMALLMVLTVNTTTAQDNNNPWAVSFGANIVDNKVDQDLLGTVKDLMGPTDWNVLPSISRVSAEKYLEKGFSLQLAGSMNKITYFKTLDDVDGLLYYAVDAIVKYDLNNLVGDTSWFDPFVYAGGGYTSIDSVGEGLYNVGFGFNTWFNENLGLNVQTGVKAGFSDKVPDHYQTSIGLVIRFGGNDTSNFSVFF